MGSGAIRIRVSAFVVDADRVLLVEHHKHGRSYWLLPGGGVEVGETLVDAATREVREETGLDVAVDRLLIVCESIEPAGRHLLNIVFAARRLGGELRAGHDGVLVDAAWHPRAALETLEMYPPIGAHLVACWAEEGAGPVRVLGNLWSDGGPSPAGGGSPHDGA